MNKFTEILIILNFIGIKMQEISFTLIKYGFKDLLKGIEKDKYNNFKKLGIDEGILKSDIFTKYIKSESVELFSLIHENIAKGIIDMYSFKQEYDSFFNKIVLLILD